MQLLKTAVHDAWLSADNTYCRFNYPFIHVFAAEPADPGAPGRWNNFAIHSGICENIVPDQ